MFDEDPVEGGLRYGSQGTVLLEDAAGNGARLKDAFAVNGITLRC